MVDPQTSTVLLFKDADKPMHPSSMAKLMTIYIAFEELNAGRLKLDTRFRVSERARNMGGSRMFVELGSEVSVEDLIKGMIVLSGNDACVVIAEGMSGNEDSFAERMTAKARELGMTGTVFKNASGWPADGQWTTARDLAVLSWRTIEDFPKLYRYYAETNWSYNNIKQENRNRLLRTVPGTDGLKTGHTEEGGYGQATSAIRDGRRLILVVNGLTSMAERAQETARLMEWGFRESTNTTVFRAGDTVVEAPVWLGSLDKVPLVVAKPVQITAPTGQTVTPRVVARFDGPIAAPIAKGTKLGTAVVTLPDNRIVEYPLEAGADVRAHGRVRPRHHHDPALPVRLALVTGERHGAFHHPRRRRRSGQVDADRAAQGLARGARPSRHRHARARRLARRGDDPQASGRRPRRALGRHDRGAAALRGAARASALDRVGRR